MAKMPLGLRELDLERIQDPERTMQFATLRTGIVPLPSATDALKAISALLKMLGNDRAGNCVSVMMANLVYLVSGIYPNQAAVWEFYKTQNPGFDENGSSSTNGPGSSHDNGMDINAACSTMVKTGMRMPDGSYYKALAFASVDPRNGVEVDECLALFGGVATGITVYEENQDQFGRGQVWDWKTGYTVDGGHGVATGGYASGLKDFATWGSEAQWASSFDQKAVQAMFCLIFPDHLKGKIFLEGVSLATAASEFKRLTGKDFPVIPGPDPTPTPPGPVPTPTSDDSTLALAARSYLKSGGKSSKMGAALKVWLAAKGL